MQIGKLIGSSIEVLYQTKQFKNVERVKWGQVIGNILIALIGIGAAFGIDLSVTDEQIAGVSGFLLAILNVYFTIGSTKKIGLKGKQDVEVAGNNSNSDSGSDELHPFNR